MGLHLGRPMCPGGDADPSTEPERLAFGTSFAETAIGGCLRLRARDGRHSQRDDVEPEALLRSALPCNSRLSREGKVGRDELDLTAKGGAARKSVFWGPQGR